MIRVAWALVVAIAVAAFVAAAAMAAINWQQPKLNVANQPYQLELFKSLLQLVTVGVFAAVVALLLRLFESDRAAAQAAAREEITRRADARNAIRAFSIELIQTYNEIKLVRRLMRARSTPDPASPNDRVLPTAEYDPLFTRLEVAQLELELFKRKVALDGPLFRPVGGAKTLRKRLKAAEKYVAAVLREFEKGRHVGVRGGRRIASGQLAHGFLAHADDNAAPTAGRADAFFRHMGRLRKEALRMLDQLDAPPPETFARSRRGLFVVELRWGRRPPDAETPGSPGRTPPHR